MSEHLCLRCKTVSLKELPPLDPRITFFECPNCGRHYALKPGKQLTFRWLHPISVILYDVIFDDTPTQRAASIGDRFAGLPPEFVKEIRLELDDPTQQVRDIVGCMASEEELREYLRLVVEHVERLHARQQSRSQGDGAGKEAEPLNGL